MAKKKPPAAASPSKRFFISCAHGNADDEHLARWLHDQLTDAKQTAFLDERMKLGAKWKDEIPRSIADCDVFIVLVSDKSNHSDAVHEEALIARERYRQTGRPLFAPVRVRFQGDLSYAMGMYLRSSQWRDWKSKDNSPTLLQELLDLSTGTVDAPAKPAATPARPQPVIDLETVATPGGAMLPDNPMYLGRSADQEANSRIKRPGETLVLLGPRQTGKSSLLVRCLEKCSERNKHVAAVDFSLFDESKFATLSGLLRELAESFLSEFRLTDSPGEFKGPAEFTRFLEERLMKAVNGPVVLVIDEVDRVFEQSYRSDFFGMIRGWHNARARLRSPWKQVDLVLAISTEPHLLMVDRYQSPFNVSPPIRLKWFDLDQTRDLNDRYGQPLPPDDVVRLQEFLGGHPYLTQLAFYDLSRRAQPQLIQFLRDAFDYDGPVAPHLNTLLAHLKERPELKLLEGFQQIVRFGQSPSDDIAYRLQAAGLVRRDDNRVLPSNELYARFFERC